MIYDSNCSIKIATASSLLRHIPRIRRTAELCQKGNHMPLSIQELKVAASFLRQAKALCEGVRDFFLGHEADSAAQLSEIATPPDNEREHIDHLIAKRDCAS